MRLWECTYLKKNTHDPYIRAYKVLGHDDGLYLSQIRLNYKRAKSRTQKQSVLDTGLQIENDICIFCMHASSVSYELRGKV